MLSHFGGKKTPRLCTILINTEYAIVNLSNLRFEFFSISFIVSGLYYVSGDAGDSLSNHNHMMFSTGKTFSTKDRDNDLSGSSCAQSHKGAWWYQNCHDSNLNGLYLRGKHTSHADGVNWKHWRDHNYSLQKTEMKIRLSKS